MLDIPEFELNKPEDIREFLDESFKFIGIDDWSSYIKVDPKFMRPAEVDVLRGNYSKAQKQLGWVPKTGFTDLVKIITPYNILKNIIYIAQP